MSLLGDLGTAIKNKLGGTSVDNTVPRYDGTTCKLQGSSVTISDTNVVTASGGFVGSLTGNASTATKLQTARTINGVAFDGTANITVSDSTAVKLTDDQTIAGVKTFSSSPIVPTPTIGTQVANKDYADTKVSKVTSTDNAVVRFNGTVGEVQNSSVIIDDSGNVGIGTSSPVRCIHAAISSEQAYSTTPAIDDAGISFRAQNASNTAGTFTGIDLQAGTNTTSAARISVINDNGTTNTNSTLTFSVRSPASSNAVTERMRIDSAGNIGIGVTPSAWHSNWKAFETSTGSLATYNSSDPAVILNANAYISTTSSATGSIYKNNASATMYRQYQGAHYWQTAPSGTAGNAITWTTAMTFNANGNLLVGTTTDNGVDKLQVNGSISASNKLVYQSNIVGTFTGNEWYDTGVSTNTLGYDILDTFAITIYENSYGTGNANWHMSYKFIVGSAPMTSNSPNTFNIPTLSAVGHANNGGIVALRWQLVGRPLHAKIQFKVTHTSTFDNSEGKTLMIYVTKLI